jgi:hypothetical protein
MTHGWQTRVLAEESMGSYGEHFRMGNTGKASSNDTEGNSAEYAVFPHSRKPLLGHVYQSW